MSDYGEDILGSENKEICKMVLDNEMVIDEISMYGGQDEVKELEICMSINNYNYNASKQAYITKKKRMSCIKAINDIDETKLNRRTIIERIMNLISFKVPIGVKIVAYSFSPSSISSIG